MTEPKTRFGLVTGVALAACTALLAGCAPAAETRTVTTEQTTVTAPPPPPAVTTTTTTEETAAPPEHHYARQRVATAHRRPVRHDDVVTKETTETGETIIQPAPAQTSTTRSTTETTTNH